MDTVRKNGRSPVKEFIEGFIAIFKGMGVTFKNLVAREKITVQYPYERTPVSSRYRGLFYLPYDEEAKRLKCVGCTLCEQACPTKVISMTKLGTGKYAGVSEFNMDLGRCMFCNLCIEACPFEAIYMGPAYELASEQRDASVFHIGDLPAAIGGGLLPISGVEAVATNNATIEAALAEDAKQKAAAAAAKAAAGGAAAPAHGVAPKAAQGDSGAGGQRESAATPNAERPTPSPEASA